MPGLQKKMPAQSEMFLPQSIFSYISFSSALSEISVFPTNLSETCLVGSAVWEDHLEISIDSYKVFSQKETKVMLSSFSFSLLARGQKSLCTYFIFLFVCLFKTCWAALSSLFCSNTVMKNWGHSHCHWCVWSCCRWKQILTKSPQSSTCSNIV